MMKSARIHCSVAVPESGKHDEEEDENKESHCALNSRIGSHG